MIYGKRQVGRQFIRVPCLILLLQPVEDEPVIVQGLSQFRKLCLFTVGIGRLPQSNKIFEEIVAKTGDLLVVYGIASSEVLP